MLLFVCVGSWVFRCCIPFKLGLQRDCKESLELLFWVQITIVTHTAYSPRRGAVRNTLSPTKASKIFTTYTAQESVVLQILEGLRPDTSIDVAVSFGETSKRRKQSTQSKLFGRPGTQREGSNMFPCPKKGQTQEDVLLIPRTSM